MGSSGRGSQDGRPRNAATGDTRPRTAPLRDNDARRLPASARGNRRGSQASVVSSEGGRSRVSQGSRTERSSRQNTDMLSRSQDYFARTVVSRGPYASGTAGGGDLNPVHEEPRDMNQFSLNSPPHWGGRLDTGRTLTGFPRNMVYSPKVGYARTQFGGMWEDHKTEHRAWPPPSGTRTGYSDFDPFEGTETTTYAKHYGFSFNGADTMGHSKPNVTAVSTTIRPDNGYGRNPNGGFFLKERMGDPKKYNHAESYRAIPAHTRGHAEPCRPGPGFTRTDLGGFYRT